MNNKIKFEQQSAMGFFSSLFSDFSEKDLVKIPEARERRPDFYYPKGKMLLEIKAIYEQAENNESARWSTIVNGIKKEIINNPKFKELKGLYSITTPRNLTIPLNKHIKCAQVIVEAMQANQSSVECLGYKFEIKKFDADGTDVVFAGFGQVRSIDPAGIINANIAEKIIAANMQLAYNEYDITNRVILLANRVYIGSLNDVIKSLSLMYDSLLELENVDQIWLQVEGKEKWFNELIYSKNFIQSFESCTLDPNSREHISLFEKWYWALDELPNKKDKILDAFHKFLDTKQPWDIFHDDNKRESMAKFGEYLLNQNDIKNAKWLISKFIDDPDPGEPENYKGKPELNYHEKVLKNKDVNVISTVQGHLAWVVKELARKSSQDDITNLIEAFNLTKDKLSKKNQNLYIILEWLFPLIEISNRRMWIANKDSRKYEEYRKLILDPMEGVVAKYAKYNEIARNLVQVFYYFKDLTTDEALFVLEHLLNSPECDAILVYFALFRDRHYKKGQEAGDIFGSIEPQVLNYSAEKVQKLFKKVITNPQQNHATEQIAWQFWKILKDTPDEFCNLAQWIDLLFKQPFNKAVFSNLERIIEDWYGKTTACENPSHDWLMLSMKSAIDYINTSTDERVDIWLSIDNLLNKVAESHPEDLIEIVSSLYDIWMKGGYIGDLTMIFSSYKLIKDAEIRNKTSRIYKTLYSKMRAENNKIPDINFE